MFQLRCLFSVEIFISSTSSLIVLYSDRIQFYLIENVIIHLLDRGFNLLIDLHGEPKSSFGFCDLDEPVVHGVAIVLSGSQHRLRTLRENKASFDMIVDWR